MSSKRMTWEEICREYPNQQVGLIDVEWGENTATIASAIVKYSEKNSTRRNIIDIAALGKEGIYSENTSDALLSVGAFFV